MEQPEKGFGVSRREAGDEIEIKEALILAGLVNIEPPRKGTKAYDRLKTAAKNYMVEVKKISRAPLVNQANSENYFSKKQRSSSDFTRRKYHNELVLMLLGVGREQISKKEADMVSDFAAYLNGDEEYVGSW